jgi:excisionase family DNA binding protein
MSGANSHNVQAPHLALIEPVQFPPILTPERAADLLDMTPDAVRKKIRKGELPGGRLGGERYYIVLEDLIARIREGYGK